MAKQTGLDLTEEFVSALASLAVDLGREALAGDPGIAPRGSRLGTMDGMSQTPAPPPPLPDSFDTAQAFFMTAAHQAGDDAAAERVRGYLVAEGSSSPAEAAFLDQYTRALRLVQDMVDAGAAGDAARSDELASQIIEGFDPGVVHQVQLGMLFSAGRTQGWLPEQDYDTLAAATSSAGAEVAEQMRHLRRGQPG